MEDDDLSSSSEEGIPDDALILSVDEMMMQGLTFLGWDCKRLECRKKETNIKQCVGVCGVQPCVVAQICEDLQTTTMKEAKMERTDVNKLHWAMHFMHRCPTETERESIWKKAQTQLD